MVAYDDDMDPTAGSGEEDEDEEMEDVNEPNDDQDNEQEQDDEGNGDDDDDDENDDNDNDDDDDGDQDEPDTPSRRASQPQRPSSRGGERPPNPAVVLTSPSPRGTRSPAGNVAAPFIPPIRPEALIAQAYDIVPTMAAPQSTSINAVTATPDMHWVFSGGTDGYVRMYNWMDTVNGKVPLTVAQKHPFVDSVMKAGSLVTYWENEEPTVRTPSADEGKWISPVYSLAVQHQAVWLLSGLESGGINLQTCRHQAGTRITTLKEHTSAVSVLTLAQDETSVLSGSWDKTILDWDLNTGKVRRSFKGAGGQISAVEIRPTSDMPIPEVADSLPEPTNGTFSSNNDAPFTNGDMMNGMDNKDGDEDAMGSPTGSLFGESHGSLFGEDTGNVGGGTSDNVFGDDDDELTRALTSEMQADDAPGEMDSEMTGMGSGGPVQPPADNSETQVPGLDGAAPSPSKQSGDQPNNQPPQANSKPQSPLTNGLPHSDEPLTAPPTNEEEKSASDLPPQSESTFLDASQDGTLRIWDRRMASPIATIVPQGGTPPWCTGACWSPDGNFIYAGRRNCSVDEYSIHHLGSKRSEANRNFKFQAGSGPVYAVRAMPNKRHLVW
jgi:transcriptional activator SPT8